MKTSLITGATGNVGLAVIKALSENQNQLNIVAGIRDLEAEQQKLSDFKISLVKFDFTDSSTFENAFSNCDMFFLLRPPQISDTKKYFLPLIAAAKKSKIKHIIFLSLQGVEKSKIIPHHKIEKMIVDSKISFTFLRPAYFMQNFTTTLHPDLVNKKRIFLPAGQSKFTLVDVSDIGKVAANIVFNSAKHINTSYELTCNEKLTFKEMAIKLSDGLDVKIIYISPNLINFFLTKIKEKVPTPLILVMIMLHYFARFQKEPKITDCVKSIIGKEPTSFQQFISNNKKLLTQ